MYCVKCRKHTETLKTTTFTARNQVDLAAYHHDLCYANHQDRKTRNDVCDRQMLRELDRITNPTLRERVDNGIVRNIINAKVNLGLGLKSPSDAIKWTDRLAEKLHKTALTKFPKWRVIVTGIDKIWAADLVDMQAFSKDNDGVRYLLTVIDVFSKYGWMIPLKTKTVAEVANCTERGI